MKFITWFFMGMALAAGACSSSGMSGTGMGGNAGASATGGSGGSATTAGCADPNTHVPCAWSHLVTFTNPVVVTNVNGACDANDSQPPLDAAGRARLANASVGRGFSKVAGHGDSLMKYVAGGGSGGGTGAGDAGGAFANAGVCGERGMANVSSTAYDGTAEFYIIGEGGLGSDVCVVRYDVKRTGPAPAANGWTVVGHASWDTATGDLGYDIRVGSCNYGH